MFSFLFIFSLANFSVSAGTPGWVTTCNYSHSATEDPIVHPGIMNLSHLHDFIGNTTTGANSTVNSLHAGGTKCVMEADKSAYWVPALYRNNNLVLPKGTNKNALIYYKNPMGKNMSTIPDGLKMIVGNAHATSQSQNTALEDGKIFFKCGPGSGTRMSAPPSQCSSGIMTLTYIFPNCWDGVNLDSADHISHMSYPKGGNCPATHPVAIPLIRAYIRYDVGSAPIGNVTLASGPYYTAHMDFFNAWDVEALSKLVATCINGDKDCGKNPSIPQ